MKKYLSIILMGVVIAGSSCKKTYLDELTNNPNTPSVAAPGLLLSGALKSTADIVNGTTLRQYGGYLNYLSRSTGYQVFANFDQYQFTTNDFDIWSPTYLNLSNYKALIDANISANYTAIAKIMTVYDFQIVVDSYNNVPYTEALQGTKNLNPKYDKGAAIYADLPKQLDAAIALIAGGAASANPGNGDIMFKGDMTKWTKFANSLKLRIALRLVNVDPAGGKTIATGLTADKMLDGTVAASLNPGYTNSDANGGQQSPLWQNWGTTQAGAGTLGNQQYQANTDFINFLTNNNDPRLTKVYAPNGDGNVIGSYFGGTATVPANKTASKFGPGVLKAATMDAYILSSAEALFEQAEAAARGYTTGDAQALYNAAITASFTDEGLTAAQATTYYSQAAIAYPTGGSLEDKIKAIITQKWAALNPYGVLEAYNDLRRTGYPTGLRLSTYPGVNATSQVTRIFYPVVEYKTNATNVGAEGTIDIFKSKIFWAK